MAVWGMSTLDDPFSGFRAIEKEWDAIPRPLPPPKPKTKIQITADDLCAGCKWQLCSDALRLAAKELDAVPADFASIKRILNRAAQLLS